MLDEAGLDFLFRDARSQKAWTDRPVDEALLRRIYDLMILGSTSGNCLPMRLVFVRSPEGKEKLQPTLGSNNVEKVLTAPVTAIVAHDLDFVDHLPRLFPCRCAIVVHRQRSHRNDCPAERFVAGLISC